MAAKWIELVTGSLEQKKQYRQEKSRIEALPEPYGTVAKALERHFMYYGASRTARRPSRCSATSPTSERAAGDDTPVRASSATTWSSSPIHSRRPTPERDGLTRNTPGRPRRSRTQSERNRNDHRRSHPRAGSGEVVQGAACAARRGLRGGAGQHLRPARLERRGQDHDREDPVHAAQGRRRDGTVDGFDVATQPAGVRESISLTGQFAAVDEILTGRENLVLVARLRHLKDAGADRR